jgi:hypothetical protein
MGAGDAGMIEADLPFGAAHRCYGRRQRYTPHGIAIDDDLKLRAVRVRLGTPDQRNRG